MLLVCSIIESCNAEKHYKISVPSKKLVFIEYHKSKSL